MSTEKEFCQNKSKFPLWMYVVVFSLLFVTDSGLTNYSYEGYYGKILFPIAVCVFCIVIDAQRLRRLHTYFFIAVAIIAASILFNSSSIGISIAYLCTLVFSYFFCCKTDFEDVCLVFLRIMRFLATVSLVLYVCVTMLEGIRTYLPVVEYSYNVTRPTPYYEIFFAHIPVDFWKTQRNYGMFWEPGTFQFYLNFALLLSVFKSNGKQFLLDLGLFGITIITTFSTTGYIALCLVLICYILCKKSTIKTKTSNTLLILLTVTIVLLFYRGEINDLVFYKFDDSNTDNGSVLSRFLSITGNFELMLRNPLLGVGFSNSSSLLNTLYTDITNKQVHQTNTMTNYFASFGLFVGSYFCLLWWKTANNIVGKGRYPLLVFISIFAMSAGENLVPSMLVNVFMFYGLNNAYKNREVARGIKL